MTTVKTSTPKTVNINDEEAVESVNDTETNGAEINIVDVDPVEKTADPVLVKKKDIYNYVSVSTGLRKRDVREAVDSLLEYMHKCLEDGKSLQVPPLGKIRPIERGSGENTKVHYKLTLKKAAGAEHNTDDT